MNKINCNSNSTIEKPSRVIFVHMEKCAGQSINKWLSEIHGIDWVTPNLVGNHRDIIRQYGGCYSLLSGHMEFDGTGLDPRYQYMTVLREPVDRLISWLNFISSVEAPTEYIKSLQDGIKVLLESGGKRTTMVLHQTIVNPYCRRLCGAVSNNITDEKDQLASAHRILQQFFLVGFFERLGDFGARYLSFSNLSAEHEIPHVNKTESKLIDAGYPGYDSLRASLAEFLQLDIALYQELYQKSESIPLRCEAIPRGIVTGFNWDQQTHPIRPYWQDTSILVYHGASLTSQVGDNKGLFRRGDGKFGFLSLGPYVHLLPSTCDVVILGEWESRGGIYLIELYDLESDTSVGTGYIVDWGGKSLQFVSPFLFVVASELKNCEVRVLVPSNHKITIKAIMLSWRVAFDNKNHSLQSAEIEDDTVNPLVTNDMVGQLLSDKTIISTYRKGVLCSFDFDIESYCFLARSLKVGIIISGSIGPNGLGDASIRCIFGTEIFTKPIEFIPISERSNIFCYDCIFSFEAVVSLPIFQITASENTELHIFKVRIKILDSKKYNA